MTNEQAMVESFHNKFEILVQQAPTNLDIPMLESTDVVPRKTLPFDFE